MASKGIGWSLRFALVTLVTTSLAACGDGGSVSTMPPPTPMDSSAADGSADTGAADTPQGDGSDVQTPSDTATPPMDAEAGTGDAAGDGAVDAATADAVGDTAGDVPVVPDTTAPTWPTSRALVTSDPAETAVTLTWTEATDDVRVTAYRVLRDDVMVGMTDGMTRTYRATGLVPGVRYTFRVEALDAAGNVSTGGPSVDVTLMDRTAPTWPAGAMLTSSEATGTALTLAWPAAMDNVAVTGYRVLRDGATAGMTDGMTRTYRVTGLVPGVRYTFRVEALDAAGNVSTDGPSLMPMLSDTRAPTWPGGSTLVATDSTATAVTLNWPEAMDDVAVTAYRVFRDGAMIAMTDGRTRTHRVTGLSTTTRYAFRVEAGDAAGNYSTDGPGTSVLLSDREPPTWPTTARLTLSGTGATGTLSWPEASDNIAVVAYRVYRDDTPIGMTDGSTRSFRLTGLRPGRQTFRVEAGDAAGNLSTDGPSLAVELTDTNPPVWPFGAVLLFSDLSDTAVTVGWPEATDDFGVTEYRVFQDGVQVATTDTSTRTYRATGLRVGVRYTFRIQARDTAGNVTTDGPAGSVTLSDRRAPTWPVGSALTVRDPMATSVTLDWTAAVDDIAVVSYRVFRDGSLLGMTDGMTRTLRATGLMAGMRYAFQVQAVDAAGNVSMDGPSATHTVRDVTAPTWPSGATLTATDLTPTALTLNWTAALDDVAVTGYQVFRDGAMIGMTDGMTRTLRVTSLPSMGPWVFRVEAVDAAGNLSTGGPTTTATPPDVVAPTWPSGASLTVVDVTATTAFLSWTAATDNVAVTAYRVFRDGTLAGMTDVSSRTLRVTGLARGTRFTFTVQALDAAGNQSTTGPSASATTELSDVFRPSAVDTTVSTTLGPSVEFLYTGPEAFQRGVAPGTIDPRRVSVLRGRATNPDGTPAAGVAVTVEGHPEYGSTVTRADGYFDLVVNAGDYTVLLARDGVAPVRRGGRASVQDFSVLPDVVMTPRDARTNPLAFGSSEAQVARGSPVTDASGGRTSILIVLPGTTVTATLPGGASSPLPTGTVRVTEVSVGPRGPSALPAELPERTAYTYVAEVSIDEATRMMATAARFSQPAALYVDNFVSAPVGTRVPAGCYDPQQHAWMPRPNGYTVGILGVTSGLADLDLDGSGRPAAAAALAAAGITDTERSQLATLFRPGQSLLRATVLQAGACALGWATGFPTTAASPRATVPPALPCPTAAPAFAPGSEIAVEHQALGETVPLLGTPFSLRYQSDRVPAGSAYTIDVPLSGATVPGGLLRIEAEATVAGVRTRRTFPASPNQVLTFQWDGRDVYGRAVQGARLITVRVGYVYPLSYRNAARFGAIPGIALPTSVTTRSEAIDYALSYGQIGAWNSRVAGLAGWTLSGHQAYDPTGRTVVEGSGTLRSACSLRAESVAAYAGTASRGFSGDGGPATAAQLNAPRGIAVGPDGSTYIVDSGNHRVRRVAPDGTIRTFAGTGTAGFSGDGGPATAAQLSDPWFVAVGADGGVYVSDTGNHRVRRVAPDGTIRTVAGTGTAGFSGDGGPATAAQLSSPRGLVVLPDGSFFLADNGNRRIRQVAADGAIFTIAGNGSGVSTLFGTPMPADGAPATEAGISDVQALAVGPDGSVYFTDTGISYIRRVDPAGIVRTVAGSGNILFPGFGGDGGPGRSAQFYNPQGLAVGPDGALYIADTGNGRVRRVGSDGTIMTTAGGGSNNDEGAPVGEAALRAPVGLGFGIDGSLHYAELGGDRVRAVRFSALPGVTGRPSVVPSADDSQLYVFDSSGRHQRTVDARTGALVYEFRYDTAGRLASIADGDGNTTTIERDAAGAPAAVVAPYGQRTLLEVDSNGDLAAVTDPGGGRWQLTYQGTTGLLESFADPVGVRSRFAYDAFGRVVRDTDGEGGATTFSRTVSAASGTTVVRSTPLGRTTTHQGQLLATNELLRVLTESGGISTRQTSRAGGASERRDSNGVISRVQSVPDPRFGMSAATLTETLTTPAGLSRTSHHTRSVDLATAGDLLSLRRLEERFRINTRERVNTYDAATRTETLRSAGGRTITRVFDPRGRVISSSVLGFAEETRTYDARGRVASVTQGGRTTAYGYDAQGLLASVTDPLGRVTRYEYDAAGRETRRVFPGGAEVRQSWDAAGRILSLTTPGGNRHAFGYSTGGRPAEYTTPAVATGPGVTRVTYNADGQVTRAVRPDGSSLAMIYDAAGRATEFTIGRGVFRQSYVPNTTNIASQTAPDGTTVTFRYDGALRTGQSWSGGPVSGRVDVGYDNTFNPSSETVNGGERVDFGYDADDLLTRAGALSLTLDPTSGRVTGTTLDQVTTAAVYNAHGEATAERAAFRGATLYDVQHTRDVGGRIVASRVTVGADPPTDTRYTFDAAGRLSDVVRDGATVEHYEYDASSNRTRATVGGVTVTGTYDTQDRLQSYGDLAFLYNAAGDLQSRRNTRTGAVTSYSYDELGNLLRADLPDGRRIDYVVDPQRHRIGKRVDGRLTQGFLWNGALIVAELDASNAVVSRFVWGAYDNVPEYMLRGGVAYRFIVDQTSSPRLLVNASTGAVVQRIDYDAFGRVTRDTNPGFQPFGYGGGLYDRDTALVRLGVRDYDPEVGRWTTKDPVGFSNGEVNLYGYVLNDPINLVDPEGTAAASEGAVLRGFILALLSTFISEYVCDYFPGSSKGGSIDKATCKLIIAAIAFLAVPGNPAGVVRGIRLAVSAFMAFMRVAVVLGGLTIGMAGKLPPPPLPPIPPFFGGPCDSPDTPIATPFGERPIADLRPGDLVMSVDHGRLVPVPVLGVNRRAVKHHRVVRVVLENGRELRISAGHPTADGRTLGMLRPGDHLGGQTVVSTEVVPYEHDATYDILPASDTGTYVAGGAVIGSTLAPPVATVTSGTGLPASALVDSAAVSTPRASPEIP